jgi:hypothetical protein
MIVLGENTVAHASVTSTLSKFLASMMASDGHNMMGEIWFKAKRK